MFTNLANTFWLEVGGEMGLKGEETDVMREKGRGRKKLLRRKMQYRIGWKGSK